MKKKLVSKEFIIGLCVLVGLIILYFGINYLKGVNLFKPGHYYYVNYTDIAGLETAAPVTVDGYKVGEVREIDFDYDKPGTIKVALSLNKNLRIPDDSEAIIVSGLMSGPAIELRLGKSKNYIPVEGVIKGSVEKGLMESVSDEIMPNVTDLIPHIDSLVVSLGVTAANLAEISGRQELGSSIRNIEKITSELAALSATLNKTLGDGVPNLMGDAGVVTRNLKVVTDDLLQVAQEIKTLPIQSSMANVEKTTANLEQLSSRLNSTNGTLGKLINDPTLYYQLNRVAADIDSLINDIKANPKRYINVKLL